MSNITDLGGEAATIHHGNSRSVGTRVLFLDIDGVLNHNRFVVERMKTGRAPYTLPQRLDPVCVRRLGRLLDDLRQEGMEVSVVLTSTWRLRFGRKAIEEALQTHWPDFSIAAETPDHGSAECEADRGGEIKAFLAENPQVQNFAILDDHVLDLVLFRGSVIEVDRSVGFGETHFKKLREAFQCTCQQDAKF